MYETLYLLRKAVGRYQGQGINHEGQTFKGEFNLQPVVEARGFKIEFTATGLDGTVFHKEESLIANSVNEDLVLWNLNNNTPGVTPHELRELATHSNGSFTLVFGFNAVDDVNVFREVITLETENLKDLTYSYAWGMPGGEFKERSSVKMARVTNLEKVLPLRPAQILN